MKEKHKINNQSGPSEHHEKNTQKKPKTRERERTDRAGFSRQLRHPARKQIGSILQTVCFYAVKICRREKARQLTSDNMLARSADVEMSMLHDMHARGRLCRSCFTFSSWSHVLKAKSVLPAGYTRRTGPGGVFNTRLIMRKPVIGRSSPVRPGPATATGRIHHHAVPCFLQTRRPPARPRRRVY